MEKDKTWWERNAWKTLGGAVVLTLIIAGSIAGQPVSPVPLTTAAVSPNSASTSTTASTDGNQTLTVPTNTNETTDGNSAPDTSLTRKTVTGVVRTSQISFNNVMGVNQQDIVFGGDSDAIDDGTGWVCIINGENNFASVVMGDTITATGEAAAETKALINCRVDSLQ